jgi:predicted ATPase
MTQGNRIKRLIKEALSPALAATGGFRRIVISSSKSEDIKSNIEKLMARPEIKHDYPVKFSIKPGAKPNTIVIDLDGQGITGITNKVKDEALKLDKGADVKIRTEVKLKDPSKIKK